jgi:hypothetical protein
VLGAIAGVVRSLVCVLVYVSAPGVRCGLDRSGFRLKLQAHKPSQTQQVWKRLEAVEARGRWWWRVDSGQGVVGGGRAEGGLDFSITFE